MSVSSRASGGHPRLTAMRNLILWFGWFFCASVCASVAGAEESLSVWETAVRDAAIELESSAAAVVWVFAGVAMVVYFTIVLWRWFKRLVSGDTSPNMSRWF